MNNNNYTWKLGYILVMGHIKYVNIELLIGNQYLSDLIMKNKATDVLVATATSVHCFINQDGKPIPLKKQFPELDSILREPCNSLNPQ